MFWSPSHSSFMEFLSYDFLDQLCAHLRSDQLRNALKLSCGRWNDLAQTHLKNRRHFNADIKFYYDSDDRRLFDDNRCVLKIELASQETNSPCLNLDYLKRMDRFVKFQNLIIGFAPYAGGALNENFAKVTDYITSRLESNSLLDIKASGSRNINAKELMVSLTSVKFLNFEKVSIQASNAFENFAFCDEFLELQVDQNAHLKELSMRTEANIVGNTGLEALRRYVYKKGPKTLNQKGLFVGDTFAALLEKWTEDPSFELELFINGLPQNGRQKYFVDRDGTTEQQLAEHMHYLAEDQLENLNENRWYGRDHPSHPKACVIASWECYLVWTDFRIHFCADKSTLSEVKQNYLAKKCIRNKCKLLHPDNNSTTDHSSDESCESTDNGSDVSDLLLI
ncbi:hypothetical protein QR680_011203 [Steinernema hermaphroditum]|uniref:F-box domain-containing protein n=1 Tax=Steinernema hermaphroditum TaxID=289476 RepID=A0AA39ITX8_9BILA|nr:hypothetical protein QR680_011203 [Steinernema hermaphroditum]